MGKGSELELWLFAASKWKERDLGIDRVGAEKLRPLCAISLTELPKVRDEMKRMLAVTVAKLESPDAARPTLGHIRSFVTSLSLSFYQLSQGALDDSYYGVAGWL